MAQVQVALREEYPAGYFSETPYVLVADNLKLAGYQTKSATLKTAKEYQKMGEVDNAVMLELGGQQEMVATWLFSIPLQGWCQPNKELQQVCAKHGCYYELVWCGNSMANQALLHGTRKAVLAAGADLLDRGYDLRLV